MGCQLCCCHCTFVAVPVCLTRCCCCCEPEVLEDGRWHAELDDVNIEEPSSPMHQEMPERESEAIG